MAFIKPLNDTVLVYPYEELHSNKFAGGQLFHVEGYMSEEARRGKVMAVGPGKYDENDEFIHMYVKDGDTVIYKPYRGTELFAGKDMFLLLAQDDIIAVVVDEHEANLSE